MGMEFDMNIAMKEKILYCRKQRYNDQLHQSENLLYATE